MDRIIPGPLPESLAHEIEQDTEGTPEEDERHVEHNGRNISVRNDPRGNELAESVAPQILVDGDGDEDTTGHRLVAVYRICRCDGWDCCDLNTRASVSNDYDNLGDMLVMNHDLIYNPTKPSKKQNLKGRRNSYLPVPFMLITKSHNEVTNQHDNHVWNECWQSHLWLSHTFVLPRGASRNPITEATICQQTQHGTNEDCKIGEPDTLGAEVVGRGGEVLGLRQVDGQEGAGGP